MKRGWADSQRLNIHTCCYCCQMWGWIQWNKLIHLQKITRLLPAADAPNRVDELDDTLVKNPENGRFHFLCWHFSISALVPFFFKTFYIPSQGNWDTHLDYVKSLVFILQGSLITMESQSHLNHSEGMVFLLPPFCLLNIKWTSNIQNPILFFVS